MRNLLIILTLIANFFLDSSVAFAQQSREFNDYIQGRGPAGGRIQTFDGGVHAAVLHRVKVGDQG